MSTYIIGDIHGCFKTFKILLKKINFNPNQDILWLLGDLVNRGPYSLEIMCWILNHQNNIQAVLGNHDIYAIACYFHRKNKKNNDTIDDLLDSPKINDIIYWMRQQPVIFFDKKIHSLIVHAGFNPNWSLDQIFLYANYIEMILKSDLIFDYTREFHNIQKKKLNGYLNPYEKWYFYLNYFTKIRICNKFGTLNLRFNGNLKNIPKKFLPWFCYNFVNINRKIKIYFGHWAALEGVTNVRNIYNLDHGCVWGGKLTAFCVEKKTYISVQSVEFKKK